MKMKNYLKNRVLGCEVNWMFNIDAVMRRKDSEIESEPCKVAKVIVLPTNEFFYFKNHLLEDHSFLSDNNDLMGFDEDNIRSCLLILGEDYDEGILVDTQGCNYARYSAHIPNARELVDIHRYQSLRDFSQQMRGVTDEVVRKILDNHQDGNYYVKDSDIPISTDNPMFSYSLLGEMLSERNEFDTVETFTHEIAVAVNPKYFLSSLGEGKGVVLTQEDVDIKTAKHTLFTYDEGGEKADFSNCVLKNINLSNAQLNGAVFNNTVFINCNLTNTGLCSSDLTGARFRGCDMSSMVCEEADFSYAKFQDCNMEKVMATHSCFVGAEFNSCYVGKASFRQCCVARAEWIETDLDVADTLGVYTSYEEWSSDNGLESIKLE